MLLIWKHMTTLCQQLQISHYRLFLEYQGLCQVWQSKQLCRSITPCAAAWFVLRKFTKLYFLFATANDLAQAKVFRCGGGKIDDQICKLLLAFMEHSGFHKSCKIHKYVPLFNHLNSVGAHLEVSWKGFVGPLKAASNQISPWLIRQRIPAYKA